MQRHTEAQEGRVELNIGGYRCQTSVQTLRRVPHTFFDAYFSGRYAQDVCEGSSIFVDRDGEHFGHILEYMRDGYVSVAEDGAHPSVSLLRALKREFGFYCIELVSEQALEPERDGVVAYVMGGCDNDGNEALSSMERYDASSGQWSEAAAMGTARSDHGACVIAGELYVTGGYNADGHHLSSVEKYSPSSDTWSAVAPLPAGRSRHAAVTVGSAMYVLGGFLIGGHTASVLKFDSTQGTYSEVAPMPESRCYFAACAVGSDILVFGGRDRGGDKDSVFKYDTVANEWSTLEPMPHACSDHSASVLDGLVYIVGVGDDGDEVLRFDPASGAWITLAPTENSREEASSFVLGGCLYAAGGFGSESSVERYDVASNTWMALANMLERRYAFSAVTIGSAGPVEEQDLFDSLITKALRRRP
jgi:N-acetylneuraminic acid mutarotase